MLPLDIVRALIRRGFTILRKEGPISLLRRCVAFLGYLHGRVFYRRSVYLYEHTLVSRDRTAYLPRLESWQLRVLESNEDADRVAGEGYEDLRDPFVFARRGLASGAVAFCVFVGRELIHVGWLATTSGGKVAVDRIPFPVAFDAGQACTGGTFTHPKYRGKGLMPYGYYERFEYLRAKGFSVSRNSVELDNVSSHRAHAKFNPTIYAIGHLRRVLWWQSWRTEELPGGPVRGMPPVAPGGRG